MLIFRRLRLSMSAYVINKSGAASATPETNKLINTIKMQKFNYSFYTALTNLLFYCW